MNSETTLFLTLNMCADKKFEGILGTRFCNDSPQSSKSYDTFSLQEQRKCPPPPPPREEKKLHVFTEDSTTPLLRERSKTALEMITILTLSDATRQVICRDFDTKLYQPIPGKNTLIQGYSNISLYRDKNSNTFKLVKTDETTRRLSLIRPNFYYSNHNIICCPGDANYKKYLIQKYELLCKDGDWFQCDDQIIFAIISEMLEKRIQVETSIKRKLDNVMD